MIEGSGSGSATLTVYIGKCGSHVGRGDLWVPVVFGQIWGNDIPPLQKEEQASAGTELLNWEFNAGIKQAKKFKHPVSYRTYRILYGIKDSYYLPVRIERQNFKMLEPMSSSSAALKKGQKVWHLKMYTKEEITSRTGDSDTVTAAIN